MRRKIIQIAGSTCLVSLPRQWVMVNEIKKGDEVEVEEHGKKLTISTKTTTSPEKIIICSQELGSFQPHHLSAAYHLGYEDVEIRYKNNKTLLDIQDRIASCIGYEIVDQGDNFCRIKTISHADFEEFDQILRKVFLLLLSMEKKMLDIFESGEHQKLEGVKVLEVTNNKLTDFCKRVLNSHGYTDHRKLTTIYTIATYLELMADEYRDVCNYLQNKKTKINPKIIKDFSDVNNLFESYYKSFYKFSCEDIEAVYAAAKPLRAKIFERMEKSKGGDTFVLHALSNILEIIYELENANIEMHL